MKLYWTILVVWFMCSMNVSVGAVLNVPSDFPTIQQAVDSASNGDTILVAPGMYVENVEILQKNDIYLIGSGMDLTTIDGSSNGHVVVFNLASGLLSGFRIENSGDSMGYESGIFTSQSSVVIEHNLILGNNRAVSISSSSNFILRHNIIVENYAYKAVLISASEGRIHDNLIINIGAYGIDCGNSSTSVINNTIGGSTTGLAITPTDTQRVCNNIFFGCENGLVLDTTFSNSFLQLSHNNFWNNINNYLYNVGSQPFIPDSGTGDVYFDPEFQDTPLTDYRLTASSQCIDAGTSDTSGLNLTSIDLMGNSRVSGLSIDIGAYEYQVPVNISPLTWINHSDFYPNPMRESGYFRLIMNHNDIYDLTLYNSAGILVKAKFKTHPKYMELQRDGLPSGLYYYQFRTNSKVQITGKLIML